jgi:hypothetical protein
MKVLFGGRIPVGFSKVFKASNDNGARDIRNQLREQITQEGFAIYDEQLWETGERPRSVSLRDR